MQVRKKDVRPLIEAGELESARKVCEQLSEQWPDDAEVSLWLAHVALQAQDTAALRNHVARARALRAPELPLARLEFQLARREGSSADQLEVLERLLKLDPGNPRWVELAERTRMAAAAPGPSRKRVRELLRAGDLEAARAICEEILAREPGAWQMHVMLADIALRTGDVAGISHHNDAARANGAPGLQVAMFDFELGRLQGCEARQAHALARLMELQSDVPRWRREAFRLRARQAVAAGNAGDLDAAWAGLAEACHCAPNLTFPDFVHHAACAWVAKDMAQLESLERLFAANPRCAGLLWCLAMVLDAMYEPVRMRNLVRENWHWAASSDPPGQLLVWDFVEGSNLQASEGLCYQALLFSGRLVDAVGSAPPWHKRLLGEAIELAAAGVVSMPPAPNRGPVTHSGGGRSNGTVVVFTGLREQAWVPAQVLDVFFAELGLHAIYVRDPNRLLFLGGLPGRGGSVEEVAASLRAEMPSGPVYTAGFSGGGIAAIVYARHLGACRTVVFSTPTTLDPVVVEQIGDKRAAAWHRRFLSMVDPKPFDAPSIVSRMPASYRLTAFAGADATEDRRHAERLQGDPRVHVELLEGVAHHDSMGHAAERHGFRRICREALLGAREQVVA